MTPKNQPGPQSSRPRRKWRRRLIWLVVLAPLVLIAAAMILGQTPLVKLVVEPIIEHQLGVGMSTRSIKLGPGGTITIRDAVLKTDSIDSRAGSLIEIDRATISMDWMGLLRGEGQVRSITIDKPLVRVSQDVETGVLNLAAMKFSNSGGGGATPSVRIRSGRVEIGEHDDSSYRVLKELSINGLITEQSGSGVSGFEFVALPTETGAGGALAPSRGSIGVSGTITEDGIDGVLDGVRLEDWPGDMMPSRLRQFYQRLALTGELAPTRFHVSNDGLIDVVLVLDGVALNLPIEDVEAREEPGVQTAQTLRMRRTRGIIRFGTRGFRADINGLIDELEYDVELDYRGFDSKSPFDATLVTDFRLDDQFKPARFLPENVISKLDRFEHPIADVHARVLISRSDEPGDGGIKVSGLATLKNGSASYKKFRYPIHDLHGEIAFEPDRLIVKDIEGVGPTGAKLAADGVFSPLGEDSNVTLNLKVQGVPIDDHLKTALSDDQRELFGALFSEPDYAHLLDEGLILTQDEARDLGRIRRDLYDRLDRWDPQADGDEQRRREAAQELARIERRLEAPIFEFGGAADVEVTLVRHPRRPEDDRWTTDIHVTLPGAGIVPQHFPLPIMARDVEMRINEQRVELTGGEYTGLRGGEAQVEVALDLTRSDAKPTVKIRAHDFPIDARLIAAIPGYYDHQSEDPDDISLRRILDRLRLSGTMECDAIIGPRSDGQLGYDVESTIIRGSARPARLTRSNGSVADPIAMDQLYGTIYVTEKLIIVDLDGMLSSPEQPLAPTPIQVLTQLTMPTKRKGLGGVRRVNGLLPTDFGPPAPGPALYATASADGVDLAMPLQHAVAVVSPRIARDLLEMKSEYNPDGVLGLRARLEGFVGGAIETTLTLDQIEHLGFDLGSTRYEIGSSWGAARVVLAGEPSIGFDEFRIPIRADGHDAGVLSLDGVLPLARGGRTVEISDPPSLKLVYENGTLDSPITQGVVDRFASASGEAWFDAHDIQGRFDLNVSLSPRHGVHTIEGGDGAITFMPTLINGELLPRSLTLSMGDEQARFNSVRGAIRFNGFEGTFDDIRARGDSTTIALDGDWTLNPGEGLGLDLTISARGDLLTGPVRAILPDTIDGVIDRLEIRSANPVELHDLRITSSALGQENPSFRIEGGADLSEGSAVIGLPITELAGRLGFVVEGGDDGLGYEIRLDASRLRAGLIRVHDAQVTIIGDANRAGVVLIPEIVAGMHGGRLAGSAQIRPGEDGTPRYWLEMHASGVRAAPVFDDLLLPPEGLEGPPGPGQGAVLSAWSQGDDLSRGAMIGDLTLTGPTGDPSKRTGRGLARISGGSVVALPGLINLVEASNLSLPVGSRLGHAEAEFYIDGQTLAFERLSASSKRIEILGYGTMDWATREVDLRFRSRAVNPIPILSGLIEKLRDELITTRVTGTLSDIEYSVQQFGSTRRLINAMLGNPVTDQQRRLREVEQQVRATEIRTRRQSEEAVQLPSERAGGSWGSTPKEPRKQPEKPLEQDQEPRDQGS